MGNRLNHDGFINHAYNNDKNSIDKVSSTLSDSTMMGTRINDYSPTSMMRRSNAFLLIHGQHHHGYS